MSLNYSEIDLILEELNLEETFIQNIHQLDYHHIIFELYGRTGNISLLVSLHRDYLRICSTRFKWKRSITLPRFSRFLRSRIKGSKIVSVKQVGKERIVEITLSKGDQLFYLFIKLWGVSANILLTDSNFTILDSFSRRPRQGETPQRSFNPGKFIRENPPERVVRDYPKLPAGSSEKMAFNIFIDTEFRASEKNKEISNLQEKVQHSLKKEIKRIEKSHKELLERKTKYSNYQTNTLYGDYIKANLYRLNEYPKTKQNENNSNSDLKEFLIVDDYEITGLKIKIPIKSNLSPMENANDYYKKAIKAKRGFALLEEEIIRKGERIKTLKTQLDTIDTITNSLELKELKDKICSESEDHTASKGKSNLAKNPGLAFFSHGYNILIGRSSDENDQLLRKYVRGSDYWLHTRDYPGGYVFIKSQKGKPIPQNVLIDAANLAVFFSKAKKNNEADLYYTQVKYLRRAKGAKKGTVLPTQEKNIFVKTEKDRLSRLLGKPVSSL